MDQPIVSQETIREKARAAFARGVGRDDHKMNWHATAIAVWQDEWDKQSALAQRLSLRRAEEVAA